MLGLTQRDLALGLGIDPSTLAHWEQGRKLPAKVYASALEDLLVRGEPSGHLQTTPNISLSEALNEVLKRAGMNRTRLASYLSVHPQTLMRWINGERQPSPFRRNLTLRRLFELVQ